MSSIENQQVRLKLTEIPYILTALKKKRRLVQDPNTGEDVFTIQFDGVSFHFTKGKVITVGENAARCLQADAWVIVGDDLTGEITPVLENVGSFELGSGETVAPVSKTVCPICNEDQVTLRGLLEHITEHEDEKLEGDKPSRRIPVPNHARRQERPSISAPRPDTSDALADANDSSDSNISVSPDADPL
jgi:hypothetical protein